ncbi:MAG: SIS domain-containing protein [Magnetococcus sp. WYHC-3]
MGIEGMKTSMSVDAILALFAESIATKQRFMDGGHVVILAHMAEVIAHALATGHKLMLCGNGGSAADAQHLAAELLVRLRSEVNRGGLPAIALAMDSSSLTACGNDYDFTVFYQRMVETLGSPGDVVLGLSTSGRSENVRLALESARGRGMTVLGFLGGDGGTIKDVCDHFLLVPSNITGRIQECHITAGHALLEGVEEILIANGYVKTVP